MKIKVLFVCLGNICRSPMAEAIFAAHVLKAALVESIETDSCGTAGYHIGDEPDHRTLAVLAANQIPIDHKGRQLSPHDLGKFDYIIAMGSSNLKGIKSLGANASAKVYKMRDFDHHAKGAEVPDPYYGSMRDFEEVYQMLDHCCHNLLQFIKTQHKL